MGLEEIGLDSFKPYTDSEFQVLDDPSVPFDIKLVEVSDRGSSLRQEVFALLFNGPAAHFMKQGIHRLSHSGLGELQLFLVPVGQDEQGFQYEAVFNRLVSVGKKEA